MADPEIEHPRYRKALLAFRFFQHCNKENKEFEIEELMRETGWKEHTVKTYISKKWEGDYITKTERGRYRVDKKIQKAGQAAFLANFTQDENIRKRLSEK